MLGSIWRYGDWVVTTIIPGILHPRRLPATYYYYIPPTATTTYHLLPPGATRTATATTYSGWWYTYPSKKNMKASWDDDIPNMMGKSFKIPWFQSPPTSLLLRKNIP